DWSRLPHNTPTRIRELLAGTLQKDRKQRLHDIGDARLTLERAIDGREWTSSARQQVESRRRSVMASVLPWILAAVFLVVATIVFLRSRAASGHQESANTTPIRLRVDVPEAPPGAVQDAGVLAISVDATKVAYASHQGDGGEFVVRTLADSRIQRLPFAS